jgi:hypothetical protein
LLLFGGWGIARILSVSTRKLVENLDTLFARIWQKEGQKREKIKHSYARIISKCVFWVVWLFFIAVAASVLGWNLFSDWLQHIFTYLPGIVTGLLIILGGFVLANITRTAVTAATHKAGVQQSTFIARLIQIAIIFSSIIIGIEQIGLNIDFLSNVIVTVIGILLAGGVLAFSLGARNLVANVIGAQYVRRHCKPGDILRIGDVEGEVIEVSQASIIVETQNGKAIIPAKYFHQQVTHIKTRK